MQPEADRPAPASGEWPVLLVIWGVVIVVVSGLGIALQAVVSFVVFLVHPQDLLPMVLATIGHLACIGAGIGLVQRRRGALVLLAPLTVAALAAAVSLPSFDSDLAPHAWGLGCIILVVCGPPLWVGFTRWKDLSR